MNTYPETLVSRVLGVKKKHLATLRGTKLLRETDWSYQDPKTGVFYTPEGIKKLIGLLGVDAAAVSWPSAEGAEPQAPSLGSEETEASAPTGGVSAVEFEADLDPASELGAPDYGSAEKIAEPQAPAQAPAVVAVTQRVDVLAQEEQARAVVHLIVTKIPINPHLVFARAAGGAADVRVRVRSNENFVPGMFLRAREPAAGTEVYSLEGNCPRRKGHY